MSVKLRKRKNKDGTTTLLLDIYNNGERRYEFLKHLQLSKGSSIADREKNKEHLELAQKIAIRRAHELSAQDYNIITDIGKKTIVTEWMLAYVDKYEKKDVRNMQGALNRFKAFLKTKRKQDLTFGQIDKLIISAFQDELRANCTGEGAPSYFNRFKKMMKHAYDSKLMLRNPATEVPTRKANAKKKDVLLPEEIQLLANTPTESEEVKKASLYALVTGLRWIDIKGLTWSSIDLKGKSMSIKQSKTNEEIYINLNSTAIKLLGKQGKEDEFVFDLPTANGANKTIKAWVKRAGIKKKITFHNFRHSFGTNLIYLGADVTTASNLLGHSSLKHTQRYVKAAKDLKQRATDALNFDL